MTYMTTVTGYQVDLAWPTLSGAISAKTIAHHLSLINRFNGATVRPYSVAEHSLLVCEIAARDLHLGLQGQLAALLHDAHESFIGDITTPMKEALRQEGAGTGLAIVSSRWERTVAVAFKVSRLTDEERALVHRADLIALATERRDLMPSDGVKWPILQGIEPAPWIDLRKQDSISWQEWRQIFTDRLFALESARDEMVRQLATGGAA